MNCLETSYIYGRKGQKQDGIDIYFNVESKVVVWQIKRYEKFTCNDIDEAVKKFLSGKWVEKTKTFTLCVSNYLDDTNIVDEIDKQFALLFSKGIIFEVLNSEKLTFMSKGYPSIINDFFGKHWSAAMGLLETKDSVTDNNDSQSHWIIKDTGEKIDPDKIFKHGVFQTKINNNTIYTENKLPDGTTAYYEVDMKSGGIKNIQWPYPLHEYKIEIPATSIIREENGNTVIDGKTYWGKIIHLKWGKRVEILFDHENGKMIDIQINRKFFIDHIKKIIHILDTAE